MDLAAAQAMAHQLMRDHGLGMWRFGFDNARRRFGCCWVTRRVITLSRPLTILNSPQSVRETILHEIAHALTPGDGHGSRWKEACMVVGARPVRCFTEKEVRVPARAAAPYVMCCDACGWMIDRRRLTRRKLVCKTCQCAVTWKKRIYVSAGVREA